MCSCSKFVLAKNAIHEEKKLERMRICHVALSRAKDEMVLSFNGAPSTIATPAMVQSSLS